MRTHFKSCHPALNVQRRNEAVATDTIYSDTPDIKTGATCAQLYVGKDTLLLNVYLMKTNKEFINTLKDNIQRRGAMDKLISDSALAEISKRVQNILRIYCIKDWQSEPHH